MRLIVTFPHAMVAVQKEALYVYFMQESGLEV